MKRQTLVYLVLIIVLAALLRLTALTFNPPSLNWDEVSHGYNAYSILKTGKDEWGKAFPLANFRAYGDYPLPLNLYLTIPFLAFLGPTELAIRLPHALWGTLTVIAIFFLAYGVTKKENVSLLAALLGTIDPWLLFPSRFVLQSNLAVFFLTSGLAFFFNRQKNKFFLPVAALCLGLTLYSYHSTRIFTPLLLLAMLIVYGKELRIEFEKKKKSVLMALIIILFFLVPLPFILANPESRARSQAVFLIDEGAVSQIEANRTHSKLPVFLPRLIYNRPVYFLQKFIQNYFGYFSPQFLFLSGGTQYQFSVPGHGLLYLINLPFFCLGLLYLLKKTVLIKKDYRLLLAWFLLSPIPAAMTKEQFAVLRSTTGLPLPQVFTALGLVVFLDWLGKKRFRFREAILPVYLICLALLVERYLTIYFTDYRQNYSWSWQYGYQQVVEYAKTRYKEYDKIIVTKKYGEPHEFFLFFWPWDPVSYQNDPNLVRFYQSNWWWVDRFDKFYFVNDWQVKEMKLESGGEIDCRGQKCLLVTGPGNVPPGWDKIKEVDFLDAKPAFEIYEN